MNSWSTKLGFIMLGVLLYALPSTVWAKQEPLDWKTHGLVALLIATVASVVIVIRNKALDTVTAKIMIFGIYFWVIIFFQAILYGLYYGLVR